MKFICNKDRVCRDSCRYEKKYPSAEELYLNIKGLSYLELVVSDLFMSRCQYLD
jgi:hypothetical protein